MIFFGRAEEALPFVEIAAALQARGHSVTVASNPFVEDLITRAGLPFIPVGIRDDFVTLLNHPDFWHPQRGIKIVIQEGIRTLLRPGFEIVRDFAQRHDDGVVLCSWHVLGARLAQEKVGIPVITLVEEPEAFASVEATPIYASGDFSGWPRWLKRWMYRASSALTDRWLDPQFNRLRRELLLVPVHRILTTWMHSPLLTVGLWPDWFALPQRDWPMNVRLTNFPFYDGRDSDTAPDTLDAFLNEGPPPVVFTLATEMREGKQFFEESADACRQTGNRGLFLTPYAEQVPKNLPSSIQVFGDVPLRRFLSRTAALVHHGGTGSTAEALAAGIPQIVMPTTFDQPDNAARVERLGVGLTILPKAYRGEKVAELLNKLKSDPSYRLRAQEIGQRLKDRDGVTQTCELIEQTANKP